MALLEDILIKIIRHDKLKFDISEETFANVLYTRCYRALSDIKAALENEIFTDYECIEEIVEIFKEIGSDSLRHDFLY